jgi:hypothetical protein
LWTGITEQWPGRRFEWLMGIGAIAIGVGLTVQPQMFDLARHYHTLEGWASEAVFAKLFFLCGVLRLVALTINGTFATFRYSPLILVLSSMAGAFLWGAFSYSFFTAYAQTAGQGPALEASVGPAIVYGLHCLAEVMNTGTAAEAMGEQAERRSH